MNPKSFHPIQIESLTDHHAIAQAIEQYRLAIQGVLTLLLDRFDRDPSYGLVDMKVDLLSGEDFPANDAIRGKHAVYGWIQGRSLEALAGHAAWVEGTSAFSADGECPLYRRIVRVTRKLLERTERLRADAGGRLRFLMTPQGQAMRLDDAGRLQPIDNTGPAHFSDLFYAKGLAAAANLLGDDDRLADAEAMFSRIVVDITAERFMSDQEQLDARNPVRPTPGHRPHSPRMIAIGAATVLLQATGNPSYAWCGRSMIEHVIAHYTNDAGDMWEFNDASGRPLAIDGVLKTDPGHATEFAGLSLKFLRISNEPPGALHDRLCRVLWRNFELGFAKTGFGIVKTVNLLTRQATNTDMPWWSLPETIRAAVEAWSLARDDSYADIARRCSNAFMRYYVRPDRHLAANQTLDAAGRPVARIPATPDADPGYHTGLSLIDAMNLLADRQDECGP